jgi:hypothetical protein
MNSIQFLKIIFFTVLFFLSFQTSNAQPPLLKNVGIGTVTPDPSAILDLEATDKGFLVPRLTTAQRTLIASPERGLLVFDIDFFQFWYFDGTIWKPIADGMSGWLTKGNTGTNASVNFLGTTDAIDFVIKTNGSAATNERLRVLSDGQIIINNPIPIITDAFSVYATGSVGSINTIGTNAINGYSGTTGIGVYGANIGNGVGVYGSSKTTGQGVVGTNDGLGDGVYGINWGTSVGVRGEAWNDGIGVVGSNNANGTGVYGYNDNNGIAIYGANAGTGLGIYGLAVSNLSFALYSVNTNTFGTSIVGVGNNVAPLYLATGSGGSFLGFETGLFSYAADPIDGTGLLAVGNGIGTYSSISGGAGITANAYNIGVYGLSTALGTLATPRAGGYFVNGTGVGAAYAYVGIFDGTVNRKIVGNGTVNTIVSDMSENPVMLSAPEAPENLFQDYGSGKLVNGKATISLDPIFSKNIEVSEDHPLRVFIQLEGDCKGVYVTNKSNNGFDVIELDSGTSNVNFTWFVTANRADEIREDGFVLKYSDERFSVAPKKLTETTIETKSYDKKFDFSAEKFKMKSYPVYLKK